MQTQTAIAQVLDQVRGAIDQLRQVEAQLEALQVPSPAVEAIATPVALAEAPRESTGKTLAPYDPRDTVREMVAAGMLTRSTAAPSCPPPAPPFTPMDAYLRMFAGQ